MASVRPYCLSELDISSVFVLWVCFFLVLFFIFYWNYATIQPIWKTWWGGGGIQQKANYVFHFSLSSAGKYFIDCSLKHWNTLLTTEKGSGLLFGAILSSVSCPLACKGAGYQIISGQSTLPPEQLSTALVCLCVERKNIFFNHNENQYSWELIVS